MKIICFSDTHSLHRDIKNIPDGDVLICAGDFTNVGEHQDIISFNKFLGELPHKHKIVVAGNHDFLFEKNKELAETLLSNAIYLENSGITIDGIKFYGTPIQPWFDDWAFNVKEDSKRKEYYDMIPEDTNVLITHNPPHEIRDRGFLGQHLGCKMLKERIRIVEPLFHIFGHMHGDYGISRIKNTRFINASLSNENYEIVNEPIVVDI